MQAREGKAGPGMTSRCYRGPGNLVRSNGRNQVSRKVEEEEEEETEEVRESEDASTESSRSGSGSGSLSVSESSGAN